MIIIYKLPRLPRKIRKIYYTFWNRFIFRINKIKFGANMLVHNQIYLLKHPTAHITIGDNFVFTSGEAFNPLCRNIRGCIYANKNSTIRIGDNVGISSACLWAKERIEIGNNVKIGGDCILMDTDAHSLDFRIRSSKQMHENGQSLDTFLANSKPIFIEDDVLIGTRCIILKGVTIGARSIIGSGSIVTKNIPNDCIAAGNPCKVIRYINNSSDTHLQHN